MKPEDVPVLRVVALTLAVIHHGMANLNPEATPSGAETVMKTSNKYLSWLGGHDETTR